MPTSGRHAIRRRKCWHRPNSQLANLQNGGKPTEIEQAEANLADARATLERATSDLARDEAQLPMGGVSKQTVDQARTDRVSAQAKVDGMRAALAQMNAPMGREDEIGRSVRPWPPPLRWHGGMAAGATPCHRSVAGRVADVLARPGETMAAGAPVVSLLPPGNIFVRFFVPERCCRRCTWAIVALACDRCGTGLSAPISFISPQAEYTPPLIYSESSKSKLVFLVEARPPADKAALFNPGEPVEVRPIGPRAP